jgi:hypothetical protein
VEGRKPGTFSGKEEYKPVVHGVTIKENNHLVDYIYRNIVDVIFYRAKMDYAIPNSKDYVPLRNDELTKLLANIYSNFNCPSLVIWDVDPNKPDNTAVLNRLDNLFIMIHYMMKCSLQYLRRPELINSIDYTHFIFTRMCKRNYYLDNYNAVKAEYNGCKIPDILNEATR